MDQLTELIELAEAEAIWGHVHAAPPDVAKSLGTAGRRIGGGWSSRCGTT